MTDVSWDPIRPPHWRWRQAVRQADRGVAFHRKSADRWIRSACELARAVEACRTQAERRELAVVMPHGFAAHEVFEQAGLRQAELEGRILAEQPYPDIACKMLLATGAVEYYTHWFFDVTDCLDASDYIVDQVIGLTWGEAVRDWYQLLPLYGYFGGPLVLDEIIRAYRDPIPLVPMMRDTAALQDLNRRLLCWLSVAVRMLPLSEPGRVLAMLSACERIRRAVEQASSESLSRAELDDRIRQLRQSLDKLDHVRSQPSRQLLSVLERVVSRFPPPVRSAA